MVNIQPERKRDNDGVCLKIASLELHWTLIKSLSNNAFVQSIGRWLFNFDTSYGSIVDTMNKTSLASKYDANNLIYKPCKISQPNSKHSSNVVEMVLSNC